MSGTTQRSASKDRPQIKDRFHARERFGCDDTEDDAYLEHLLDRVGEAGERGGSKVTVGEILQVVGPRSFAPLLVLVGLLITSPLSGIPLFPSIVGAIVFITSLQIIVGRRQVWLPSPLMRMSVPKSKLRIALGWLLIPARFVDRHTEPRLMRWVHGPSVYLVAILCMLFAALMPVMEFVPFSATLAGVMLTTFGVALVARDGLLCILAYGLTAAVLFVIVTFIPVGIP